MTKEGERLKKEIRARVPKLRNDFVVDRGEMDAVAWSPTRVDPIYLDPISTMMLEVVDGIASVGTLADEVADVLEIDSDVALNQVSRIERLYNAGGLLLDAVDSEPLVDLPKAHSYVPDW